MVAETDTQRKPIIESVNPLTNELLVALINKSVVQKGTELLVPRLGKDLSGSNSIAFDHIVEVIDTKIKNGTGYCLARSLEDNASFRVSARLIHLVDGMNATRIAQSFGLKPDGSIRSTGKKRGRKPKIRK